MKVIIYAKGLVHCSACVTKDLSREDIEMIVNTENPTGINSQWKISEEKFASGEDNPGQCEKDSNRMHYLFVC